MGAAHTVAVGNTQTDPFLARSLSLSLALSLHQIHIHTQLSQRTAVRQADHMTRIDNTGSGTRTQNEN